MVSPIDHFSLPSMSISEFFKVIDDQNLIESKYPSKPKSKSPIGSQIKPSNHEFEFQDLQQCEARVSSNQIKTPLFGEFKFPSKPKSKSSNGSQIKHSNHEFEFQDLEKNQQGEARASSNQLKLPLLCNFDATHEDDDDRFINQSLMSNSEFFLFRNDQNQIEFEIPSKPTLNSPNGSLKSPLLGKFEATNDDDNDGFRTPTSLEHKIPVMKECPPAPRKPLPPPSPSRKRSSMSPRVPRNLQIDIVKELEAMLPLIVQEDEGQKIKKARK